MAKFATVKELPQVRRGGKGRDNVVAPWFYDEVLPELTDKAWAVILEDVPYSTCTSRKAQIQSLPNVENVRGDLEVPDDSRDPDTEYVRLRVVSEYNDDGEPVLNADGKKLASLYAKLA
jgi:hypothetical protein